MKNRNNLLTNLYRWCNHQGENFTTEAFTHLLCHLLDDEPQAAASTINIITDSYLRIGPDETKDVRIRAQPTTPGAGKRPDIEICYPGYLIFIEVKIHSMFGECQMSNYLRELENCGIENTRLITITKYDYAYHQGDPAEPPPGFSIRWYQIAEHLESMLASGVDQGTSRYLIEQLTEFLIEEGVTMIRVDQGIETGIRSMVNLLSMITQALARLGVKPRLASGLTHRVGWAGCYFSLKKRKHFLGVYFDEPATLVVNTEYRAHYTHGASPQLGRILKHGYWEDGLDLTAAGFFSLAVGDQMQCVDDFAAKSVDYINKHIVPD